MATPVIEADVVGATPAAVDKLKTRQRTSTVTLVALAAVLNVGLLSLGNATVDVEQRLYGSVMLWLAAIPCIEFLVSKRRQLPLFPMIVMTYWLYYARPLFADPSIEMMHQLMPNVVVTRAAQQATIGLAAMVIGYYALPRGWSRTLQVKLDFDIGTKQDTLMRAAPFALLSRILPVFISVPGVIAQLVVVVSTIGLAAVGALFVGQLRGVINQRSRNVMIGMLALQLLIELGSGSVANPIRIVIFLGLLYIRERGTIPWAAMVISAALIFPLLTTKHAFRAQTWGGEKSELGPIARGFYFIELTVDLLSSGEVKQDDLTQTASDRFTHLGTLAWVMQMTPGAVPYWNGDTYLGFFWTFVPRFIYPDKPNKTLGSDFGHRYGLLDSADYATSYNFEQLVEAYANFGETGVVVVSLIAGALYRLACGALDHEKGGIGGTLLLASVALILANIESDFSIVFGGVFYTIIGTMVGMRMLTGSVGQRVKT